MRKNLHYKVLASVLAIAGLYFYNAPAAWADIIYDAYQVKGDGTTPIIINKNEFKINDTTLSLDYTANVYGNYQTKENATGDGTNNNVTIQSSKLDSVYGAHSENADANNNNVLIEGDNNSFCNVIGGSTVSGEATVNTVTITGKITLKDSATSYIAGGVGSGGSTISNNHVIIEGGTVKGNIYGGYGVLYADGTTISGNKITVKNSANVEKANLYGGYNRDNSYSTNIKDNKLIIDGWQNNKVASLHNFSDIYINNFKLNTNLIDVGSVNGMEGVTIHLGAFTGDIALAAGDYEEKSSVEAAKIEWDEDIKGSVVFTDENGNDVDVDNFDDSLFAGSLANQTINNTFYIADRTDGDGVYATKFNSQSGYSTSHEKDANYVSITAKVKKSVLAGKFIDESGKENINTQTKNSTLTIGEGFTTEVGTVAGVYAASGNNATDGKLIISGNTDYGKDLYGAYAENGNAENSTVEISGNTDYSGTVYAGYSESGEVNNNTISVASGTKAENMSLSGTNTTGSGNELNISGNGSTFKKIENFNTINFNDVALNTADAALTVASADVDGATINVNSLEGGKTFSVNDTLNLIAGNLTGEATLSLDDTVTAGLTQDLSLEKTINSSGIQLAVKDVSMNGQINLVAENRAVAAAFVNQGTDLISDSLDTLSRDGSYGVKTFAAVHGNRSKYNVNSDLKINGWSTIVGVGNAAEFAGGDEFSWGVFYENGSGNYRTYNEFNNEFFRGDGNLVYNGGGIAARYENASGVYTEGSLRAGMLKSEMDNALRDGAGNYYGYDSESAYYGAHIGVGKIISLSDSSDLDVYGKFFHTYTEGDSFTVAKDKFEFDSITSDRLRIGARVTTNKANAFSTYYGLAYEYEFNGDADMRAQNLKAPTQSLQGSSYMAEVGFNYQPTPDSPWSFDLNMRGYAGEREGASFNVQATYTF